MKQNCKNCRFKHILDEYTGTFQCRRFPPTRTDEYIGQYPEVFAGEWCGEWKKK